jgi:branched-chain amino acid aminotransferase
MDEPLAFLNGNWIPASQAVVPATDSGFVLGVAVAEQLRTFSGELFHLDDHLARLRQSLEIIGADPGMTNPDLAQVARELVARNHRLLSPGDDLGLSIFVTPGTYAAYALPGLMRPLVCMHTYPLPFYLWADKYTSGQELVVTKTLQVPGRCWPANLKCRSRMHYYLADREAAGRRPGARALLLDETGAVTETSTANVIIYNRGEGLVSPPDETILHGISLNVAFSLAAELGVPTMKRRLTADDVRTADEVLLSSTPLCLLPVTSVEGRAICDRRPGALYTKLMAAWDRMVGLDIAAQARQFAQRAA